MKFARFTEVAATLSIRAICKIAVLTSLGSLMRSKHIRGQAARPARSDRELMHQILDLLACQPKSQQASLCTSVGRAMQF